MSYLVTDVMADYTDRSTGNRQVRASIVADTAADLPANTTALTFLLGSYAKTVDTGDEYWIDSSGSWILQPSSSAFSNVYTKTEIDQMLTDYYTNTEADSLFVWKTITISGNTPLDFIADGEPLDVWSIYGNMTQDVPPGVCGDKTANLVPEVRTANGWRKGYRSSTTGEYVANQYYGEWLSPPVSIDNFASFVVSAQTYASPSMSIYYFNGETYLGTQSAYNYSGSVFNNIPNGTTHFDFAIRTGCTSEEQIIAADFWVMLNTGGAALPYEPYGYTIPITCGSTHIIYLSEPLRKAIDGSDAVDVMSSDGTITRNVDSDGNELTPPTTETFTAPTITPDPGENTLTVDTTTPPSEITITGQIRET